MGDLDNRGLVKRNDEFLDNVGRSVTLCVVEELMPAPTNPQEVRMSEQAITIFEGWALCRKHLHQVGRSVVSGYSKKEIILMILMGNY